MPNSQDYFKSQNYRNLIGQIDAILKEDHSAALIDLDPIRLKNYWTIGRKIIHAQKRTPALKILHQRAPALIKIADDLKTGASNLYKMTLFYRTWPTQVPIGPKQACLSWAAHCELLGLEDKAALQYYHDAALSQEWNRDALRSAIRMKLFEQIQQSGKHGIIPQLERPLYAYKATPLRVLDGDTLKVRVDLGFTVDCEPILRLRGVNTPELGKDPTGRAEKAKARLEEILQPLPFVIIRSYKTDVYGRYLADVYYHPTLQSDAEIIQQGTFLNQQILDEGLGDWMVM